MIVELNVDARNEVGSSSPIHVKHGVCVPLNDVAQTDAALKLEATAILVPHRQPTQDQRHGFINISFINRPFL